MPGVWVLRFGLKRRLWNISICLVFADTPHTTLGAFTRSWLSDG